MLDKISSKASFGLRLIIRKVQRDLQLGRHSVMVFPSSAIPHCRAVPAASAGAALRHLLCTLIAMSFFLAPERRPPLKNTAPSIDDLGKQVLEAVEKKNFKALDALRLNEQEYRAYIWPALPISKIKQWQKQYQYVWSDVDTKSKYGLQFMLRKFGGQKLDFVRMRFTENAETYDNCTIHKDARVIVKDSSGAEKELKLFGSVVECSGQFKIMSYNVH